MRQLSARLLPAIAIHFSIHIAFFTLASWVLLSYKLGFNLISVLACGFLLAMTTIFLEWILSPTIISSKFKSRWVERDDDLVLWSMVEAESIKARVKVKKIGIVDIEAPNAFIFASHTGRPIIFFTKGLLIELTYTEVRAVVAYLIGCSKSGVLGVMTTLSGLLTISHSIAGGYISCHLEGKNCGMVEIILAGWGGLLFALICPYSVMLSRFMSVYGDRFSISQTGDPMRFLSALLKTVVGMAMKPLDPIRANYTSLKCLMFQDPTIALRDASEMKAAAKIYGIDLSCLLRYSLPEFPDEDELKLHVFEKFWSQLGPVDRMKHVVELGRGRHSPQSIV